MESSTNQLQKQQQRKQQQSQESKKQSQSNEVPPIEFFTSFPAKQTKDEIQESVSGQQQIEVNYIYQYAQQNETLYTEVQSPLINQHKRQALEKASDQPGQINQLRQDSVKFCGGHQAQSGKIRYEAQSYDGADHDQSLSQNSQKTTPLEAIRNPAETILPKGQKNTTGKIGSKGHQKVALSVEKSSNSACTQFLENDAKDQSIKREFNKKQSQDADHIFSRSKFQSLEQILEQTLKELKGVLNALKHTEKQRQGSNNRFSLSKRPLQDFQQHGKASSHHYKQTFINQKQEGFLSSVNISNRGRVSSSIRDMKAQKSKLNFSINRSGHRSKYRNGSTTSDQSKLVELIETKIDKNLDQRTEGGENSDCDNKQEQKQSLNATKQQKEGQQSVNNKFKRAISFRAQSIAKRQLSKQLTQVHRQRSYSLSNLLKLIKKYMQIVATGEVDDVEKAIDALNKTNSNFSEEQPNNGHENSVCYQKPHQTLRQIINRKKIIRSALYFERAAVVAGVSYALLLMMDQNGSLRSFHQKDQKQGFNLLKNSPSSSQSFQSLESAKQLMKYVVNCISFVLSSHKALAVILSDYLNWGQDRKPPNKRAVDSDQKMSRPKEQDLSKIQSSQIKKQFQLIRLNLQYLNDTISKIFTVSLKPAPQSQKQIRADDFGESFRSISKLIQRYSIQEAFYALLEYFAFYVVQIQRQHLLPFLAVVPNPYLEQSQKLTLVIDLVDVFCYGSDRSRNYIFRPYSEHFLKQMSQYYEIVVFCNALPSEIDKVIDILDPRQMIRHRLYRHHMVQDGRTKRFAKKLNRIGRDLDTVLMIDVEENRREDGLECPNTIFVKEWRGSKNDSTLAELCGILAEISVQRLSCAKAATLINEHILQSKQKGIKHLNFGLNLCQEIQGMQKSSVQKPIDQQKELLIPSVQMQ